MVADKVGGQVFGAFDDERMVAFCWRFPDSSRAANPYLHSHMLGVLPEYRDSGVGRQLKLRQREEALERGIELIEWTFDPLELKNAYFNIERLGAIVRRYVQNQYGTTTSQLHGGLPTDRCMAEWWIATPRVPKPIAREPRVSAPNAAERDCSACRYRELRGTRTRTRARDPGEGCRPVRCSTSAEGSP